MNYSPSFLARVFLSIPSISAVFDLLPLFAARFCSMMIFSASSRVIPRGTEIELSPLDIPISAPKSSSRISSSLHMTLAPSMQCRSWRMFPGQSYLNKADLAFESILISLPFSFENSLMKESIKSGISSLRSLNAGTSI